MTEIRPKLLRIHAQSEMVALPSIQSGSGELGSDSACSATEDGAAVLYLVYQAAEALTAAEDRANDIEARAQTLARRAMEEMKLAQQRVHAVDAERQAIESKLSAANTRVQECELALERSESRNAVAEAKLTAAEQRAVKRSHVRIQHGRPWCASRRRFERTFCGLTGHIQLNLGRPRNKSATIFACSGTC
jgi:hypothetical protein